MSNVSSRSRLGIGALALAPFLGAAASAAATDPARTIGFVFGSVAVVRNACGFPDDPDGLSRLLVSARLEKAMVLPGGARRGEVEAGRDEARIHLTAKLAREGRESFCAFAEERFGARGLGVVRG